MVSLDGIVPFPTLNGVNSLAANDGIVPFSTHDFC